MCHPIGNRIFILLPLYSNRERDVKMKTQNKVVERYARILAPLTTDVPEARPYGSRLGNGRGALQAHPVAPSARRASGTTEWTSQTKPDNLPLPGLVCGTPRPFARRNAMYFIQQRVYGYDA